MTNLIVPFTRRASFRKLPYEYDQGRGVYSGGLRGGVTATLNLDFTTMTALPSTITFSRPSNATYYDSTGKLTYAPNNLLLNTATLSTQNVTTAPINYILSFQGTGSVVLSGTFIGTLTGTGVSNRVSVAFTPTAGTLTLTVVGSVTSAQLEAVTYQTTPGTYNATTSAVYYGARLDYNPATLAARGLLIEEARTNAQTYSQDFDNGAWVKGNTTVTANTTTSPDGTVNAETLTAAITGLASHNVYMFTVPAANFALSVFAKKGTSRYVFLVRGQSGNGYASAVFDLDGGGSSATQTSVAVGNTISSTQQENVGNGWFRLTLVSSGVGSGFLGFGLAGAATGNTFDAFGGVTFATLGTETFYIWGAQAEAASFATFATSYIPTAASSVARSADTASMTGANFSSWYNQTEGTFVVNATPLVATGNAYSNSVFGLLPTTGTGGGSFFLGQNLAKNWLWWRANGSMAVTFGTVVANTPAKLATAYKLADYAAVANNGTVGTSSDATALVNATSLSLGGQYANQPYGEYIASVVYYPQRLPNATLQSLTS